MLNLKGSEKKKEKIYSTSPMGGLPPWEMEWKGIMCLVIGSEPQEIVTFSDSVISVPQLSGESLNVALSTFSMKSLNIEVRE